MSCRVFEQSRHVACMSMALMEGKKELSVYCMLLVFLPACLKFFCAANVHIYDKAEHLIVHIGLDSRCLCSFRAARVE